MNYQNTKTNKHDIDKAKRYSLMRKYYRAEEREAREDIAEALGGVVRYG